MFIGSDNIIVYYPKISICSPSVTYMISALHDTGGHWWAANQDLICGIFTSNLI